MCCHIDLICFDYDKTDLPFQIVTLMCIYCLISGFLTSKNLLFCLLCWFAHKSFHILTSVNRSVSFDHSFNGKWISSSRRRSAVNICRISRSRNTTRQWRRRALFSRENTALLWWHTFITRIWCKVCVSSGIMNIHSFGEIISTCCVVVMIWWRPCCLRRIWVQSLHSCIVTRHDNLSAHYQHCWQTSTRVTQSKAST